MDIATTTEHDAHPTASCAYPDDIHGEHDHDACMDVLLEDPAAREITGNTDHAVRTLRRAFIHAGRQVSLIGYDGSRGVYAFSVAAAEL